MTNPFQYYPAYAQRPCLRRHGNGVIFSAVFRAGHEHALQLIHLPDGETFEIPLTEEYRLGRVYSVRITPFQAEEWVYRYRSGGHWMVDPCAPGLQKFEMPGSGETCTVCTCAPLDTRRLLPEGPERPLPPADWSRQIIFGLHVRGLTAGKPESFPGRGTFAGVSAMIPYLQDLGITAIELMPVYQPLAQQNAKKEFRTMQEALGAWPVGPQGDPLRDMKERPNYWGFGRGLYYALRPSYGTSLEFAQMIHALHQAGIRVLLQVYFEKGIQPVQQIDLLRFYIDSFGVDGFRLLGHIPAPQAIASDPSLADTALLCDAFPFEQLQDALEAEEVLYGEDLDSLLADAAADEAPGPQDAISAAETALQRPQAPSLSQRKKTRVHAPARFPNLVTCREDFQTLLRRFVKSDDYVMKDFLKAFLSVPEEHGELRTVTSYEGFTLADLVSYTERHNEANGEFGLDGRADNYSWNCGEEGATEDPAVLALRRRQMRNFLTLLFLAQGTPMLRQGDERCNSQGGNNNPYCQDNETAWVDWTGSPDADRLTAFTAKLIAFRKEHPVFYSTAPFHYIDTLGIGHPDVSLHGEEAWKPDLGAFSHSIGIAYCENYADPGSGRNSQPSFVYLAVNMYWKELSLALPKLPPYLKWKVCMDTAAEEGFLDRGIFPSDQHLVEVMPRSIRILKAVPDIDAILRNRREERRAAMPSASLLRRAGRKKMNGPASGESRRLSGHAPGAVRRILRLSGRKLV